MSTIPRASPARSITAVVLHGDQATALEQIQAHLDQPIANKLIALLGGRGSGKTALIQALLGTGGQPARTTKGRKIMCAVIDLLRLSEDMPEWQVLLFTVLEALSRQPNAPTTLGELSAELVKLVRLGVGADTDASADLALAAFTHRFRMVFAEALGRVGAPSSAVFLVIIDHVDKARPDQALAMLEAARYFLSRQECALLACAHEDSLADDVRDVLRGWMTARVDLREAPNAQPNLAQPSSLFRARDTRPAFLQDLPPTCADLFFDHLGDSPSRLTRAVDRWRSAMRTLVRRGERYDSLTTMLIARLCLLHELSPAIFDAAALDVALLPDLERRARSVVPSTGHPWANVVSQDARLRAFFAESAGFVGVDLWALAAALRIVQYADADSALPLEAKPSTRAEKQPLHPQPASQAQLRPAAMSAPSHLWQMLLVVGVSFALDRLAKLIAEASGNAVLSLQSAISQPLNTVASTAIDLSSLVLCTALVALWQSRRKGIYGLAYGLLLGGLLANLADRLVYGAVMNLLQVSTLPVFNLAHVSILAGAGLLAWGLLTRADEDEL